LETSLVRPTRSVGRRCTRYDADGIDLLTAKQKVNGTFQVTGTRSYNPQQLPLTTTDAGAGTTTITYNSAGQVLAVTPPPPDGHSEGRRPPS
jgi:YD repeat-containing protein